MSIRDRPDIALELQDLKDYIVSELIGWNRRKIESFYFDINCKSLYRRPYWIKNLGKNIDVIYHLLAFSKPSSVEYFLKEAQKHFDKNPRHRAFNILFEDYYCGTLIPRRKEGIKSRFKRFHYYLAIRICKKRYKIIGKNYKVLCYVTKVTRMCPMGQVVHMRISEKN